ncbi:hypothetical protein B0H11DRAFT_2099419, partial [Mycena galericulata]
MSSSVSPATGATKRKARSTTRKHHICSVCERGFSTTGHLARHTRVHTGERNHKCPFPGCETKCSRQDNLQQHYRIHLSPGSRRKSGRSVLRSKSTRAPSPPAASPSASVSTEEMYHREDSPPIEPPALEDSRLYYFARGVLVESPPNSPPPLVKAYLAAVPMHHRELPQINTAVSVSVSASSSPEMYWPSQQSQQSGGVSPVSDSYGSCSAVSVHQSPVMTQSQYAQSAATSPALSPVVSYASLTSTSNSPLVSAEGYLGYEQQHQQRMPHAPQPHSTVCALGPYTHLLHHNSSQTPAAFPVSRGLATRHSIANIAAHAHVQQQQQQAYTTTEPALGPDSHSPPTSSHHSPQTPYTSFHVPAYVAEHYAAQREMGNIGMAASGAYAAYDAHGNLLAPAHAQGQVQYTPLETAPVLGMQCHPYAPAPHEVHGHMQKPWSPQPMLTDFPSLRRASHGHSHVHVHGHGGSGGESYPAARRDSYPQYVHVHTSQQEGYLAYAGAPANVEVEEEREWEAPQPYICQTQPQPRFHPQYFAGYGRYSTTG